MAAVVVIDIAQANRNAGTYTFAAPQPVPAGRVSAKFEIILDTADKLAGGKTLTLTSFHSADNGATWLPVNSIPWTSYGSGGFTLHDIGGTTTVNPNPRFYCALAPIAGHLLRLEAVLNQALNAGVLVTIT